MYYSPAVGCTFISGGPVRPRITQSHQRPLPRPTAVCPTLRRTTLMYRFSTFPFLCELHHRPCQNHRYRRISLLDVQRALSLLPSAESGTAWRRLSQVHTKSLHAHQRGHGDALTHTTVAASCSSYLRYSPSHTI